MHSATSSSSHPEGCRTVLHLVWSETLGGGVRAPLAAAKYSTALGNFRHDMAFVLKPETAAIEHARQQGVTPLLVATRDELMALIPRYDIVQLDWWNMPELDAFLRAGIPSARLLTWIHVAGHSAPQVIPPALIDFSDFVVASCPYCYQADAIQTLPAELRARKTAMIYDAADFQRLASFSHRKTGKFVVGYIGLLERKKLHPDFISMSASIRVPGIEFVVCGDGNLPALKAETQACNAADRFVFRGFVENVRAEIETFDVYGYPVREDTYAAGELNLQEVMFAGVPPVVFPYGGIRDLVVPEYTGLVVRSAQEYRDAIEHLFHSPEERQRLGRNAQSYARQIFGAHNWAPRVNAIYQALLQKPKRLRTWQDTPVPGVDGQFPAGAAALLPYLGRDRDCFERCVRSEELCALVSADRKVSRVSSHVLEGGVLPYLKHYPADPVLRFWAGLIYLGQGNFLRAYAELSQSIEHGFRHYRATWYCAKAALLAGKLEDAQRMISTLLEQTPAFICDAGV